MAFDFHFSFTFSIQYLSCHILHFGHSPAHVLLLCTSEGILFTLGISGIPI